MAEEKRNTEAGFRPGAYQARFWPEPEGFPELDLEGPRTEARKVREGLPRPLAPVTAGIGLLGGLIWTAAALLAR